MLSLIPYQFSINVPAKPEVGITDLHFCAFATGVGSIAAANLSEAHGKMNLAVGQYGFATGGNNIVGYGGFVSGEDNTVLGYDSHAEGYGNNVSGGYAHAEGSTNVVSGATAHAEGVYNTASGGSSHAEGNSTEARANQSHVEGFGTVATLNSQHVQGKYNELDENGEAGNYAHIVGWGTSTARKNIHTLDTVGTAKYAGDVYARNKKLATEEYVNTKTAGLATKEYVDSKEVKLPFETVGGIVKLPRLILTDSVTGQDYYIEMQNGNLVSYAVNNNNSNDGYIIQGDTITLNGTWHDEDGQPLLIASSGYFYCDEGVHFNVDDIISFSGDVSNAKYTVTEVSYDPAQSEEYYVHFNGNYTPIDGDIVTKWLKQGE